MKDNIKASLNNLWSSIQESRNRPTVSIYLAFTGFLVGVFAGCVIAVFRRCKDTAYHMTLRWVELHEDSSQIFIYFGLAILAALITGFLIKNDAIRFGGDSWIKDALANGQKHAWRKVLFPKFLGSWLVLASGISVGSEGPSIEMGAATALGLKTFTNSIERRYFILGGCAAGLSAAFSAPFAGICYVYEIMKEKMDASLFLFLLGGSFGVYFSVTLLFGLDVMLPLGAEYSLSLRHLWILLPLGVFAGLSGVVYNYLLRISVDLYSKQKLLSWRFRPLCAFLGAAVMMLVFPAVTGEGTSVFTSFPEWYLLSWFLGVFVIVKLLFTAFCYGTGIPAGRMVPVLCIGGAMGGIYADCVYALQLLPPGFEATFVVLGMASAFAASECAPITALVLVCQMTGSFAASLPMLVVTAIAWSLARLCRVKTS